jgi:hypothetical protein
MGPILDVYDDDLIIVPLKCFEHPNVHPQEDCTCSFVVFLSCIHISSLVDGRMCLIHILLIWMHETNTTKQRVQVFLRTNTLMLETCRKHHN